MAYLAKGNKPDLLSVCEEMGVEVDQSSKGVDIKKLILNSQFYVEEEVKIILDRVISDRKEQERRESKQKEREERSKQEKEREERNKREEKEREERMAREARQHELELRKLELSHQNQPLSDESGRRVEIRPKIQLTQITTKFDEKHDEISLYLINFERKAELAQVPKKDWVAYLLAVLPAELSNMLAREPTERANNYDFVKGLILKSPQCDKLKKTPESISHVVTDKSFDELMARYTSLGKVNGVEMKILRDTEVELDCEMGHVITKVAVLRDSLDQGRYLLGNKTAELLEDYKPKEDVQMHMINAVKTRAQKKLLEVENERFKANPLNSLTKN
ncbi:SCAN box domain-containing protein [Trichonephila inaurata madagascariensis]|uniref:SCAN box domain-containing protein n=1 Tax=Trichonephila inaurata madagascariensis TaxID=2747483 RepID=A0A8X6ILY8_9ARAC|nr:SCAN box domain-containing protein [Trichonephila inaurata madagascariensis]